MAKEKYVYPGRDASTVKARAEQSGGAFDSYIKDRTPTYKVRDGANELRVLPPTWDTTDKRLGANWGIELWLHYNIGPDKNTYLCLNKMLGKPCYLCDVRREIEAEDEQKAKDMRPNKRTFCWVIDRKDEAAGPQAYPMPWTLESEIQTRSLDKKTKAALQIDHPDEGYDISFDKTGAQLKTKYSGEEVSRDPTAISDNPKLQDKWMNYIIENPLPTLLVYHDNDYLKAVFGGKGTKDDDGEDKGTKKPAKKTKGAPTEDEIGEMTRDELEQVIEDQGLSLDLDDFPGLSNKRDAVWESLKETAEDNPAAKKPAKKPVEEVEEPEEEAEEKSAPKKPAKKAKPVTEDEVDEMDADELQEVIDSHSLKCDLDDYSSLSKKRAAVWESYTAKGEDGEKAKPTAKPGPIKAPTEDEIDEMDPDELGKVIKTHKLGLDLDDYSSLSKKRAAVWAAIEGLSGKKGPAEEEDVTETARKGISRLKRTQAKE